MPLVLLRVHLHQHRNVLRPESARASTRIHPVQLLSHVQSGRNPALDERHLLVQFNQHVCWSTGALHLRGIEELFLVINVTLVGAALHLAGTTDGHSPQQEDRLKHSY